MGKTVDAPGFRWPTRGDRLAAQCDALFISHEHRDHADPMCRGVSKAREAGCRAGLRLDGTPLHSEITHLKREADTVKRFPFRTARSSYSS